MGVLTARNPPAQVEAFVETLVARAAELRLSSLLRRARAEAMEQVIDRNGVSVVVVESAALSETELEAVLRFRAAQYLAAGFADPQALLDAGLEHEPLASVAPSEVLLIAGTARDGEILCTMSLRGVPSDADQPMRSRDRPPFPVEEIHGMGIYDRLAELPDIPAGRVREMGRYVKNQRLYTIDELGARAPIEVSLALIRALVGPLRTRVDAILTEVEEGVAKRNLDFFGIPTALIRGTVGYEAPSWLCGHEGRTFYPVAISTADLGEHVMHRADAIERALACPGREGVVKLLALRRTATPARSRFEPPGGVPALAQVEIAHASLPMGARAELRRGGELLRQISPLSALTPAEATVLRTMMLVTEPREGDVIVKAGAPADALYLIEEGEAEAVVTGDDGRPWSLGRLGPGNCFGEIALVLGTAHTAAIIARSSMRLLRLPADIYRRYVATIDEVESAFSAIALGRMAWR